MPFRYIPILAESAPPPEPAFEIVPSANIAAGGEATTAYGLTAPSGKTSGDFFTGRRWDDENGTDSTTPTADGWTKLAWPLQANSAAVLDTEVYEFRVVADDDPLDTYTVTPTWTIGTPPPPPRGARVDVRHERVLTLPAGFMAPVERQGVPVWLRVANPTVPALVLSGGSQWTFEPAAGPSSNKLYLTAAGQIVARTSPVSGDRLLTLSGGVMQAAAPVA